MSTHVIGGIAPEQRYWIAAHQGPEGTLSRFTHASREIAGIWLYTTMGRCEAPDIAPEMRRLAASARDMHFTSNVGDHWFALSEEA